MKYCFKSAVAIALCFQLWSACYTGYKRTVEEMPLQSIQSPQKYTMICAPPTINYCLESIAAITLCFQLCSARYTALQMKNSVRIASAINPVTTENMDDSRLQCTVGEPCIVLLRINTLDCQQKEMGHKGGQR